MRLPPNTDRQSTRNSNKRFTLLRLTLSFATAILFAVAVNSLLNQHLLLSVAEFAVALILLLEVIVLQRTQQQLHHRSHLNKKLHQELQNRKQIQRTLLIDNKEIKRKSQALNTMQQNLSSALEKIQAEKELLAKEKALDEAIWNSIGDGLFVVNQEGHILLMNDNLCRMLHIPSKESLYGQPFTQTINMTSKSGNHIPADQNLLTQTLEQGVLQEKIDGYYSYKDHGPVHVHVTTTPIHQGNETIGAVGIVRDLSDQSKIERAKTDFILIVSHQLRNPLTPIKLFAEMLADGTIGPLNVKQKTYVDYIYRSADRMTDLLNELLDFAQIESGALKVKSEETKIDELIESVIETFKPLSAAKQCHVRFEKVGAGPFQAWTDRRLLQQVIQNLIDNSIKYSRPGVCSVVVKLEFFKKDFGIQVIDNGLGIPQKSQNQVFDKFYRGDNVRGANTEGTGLGLYITKILVEALSGKIWFNSDPNQGSDFQLTLPIQS